MPPSHARHQCATPGNFDEALRCMDNLFLSHGKRYTNVTTAGIPTPPA
jgi:hypothetical protein